MVNKSYKFIKYIFYILCIVSLFFSIKDEVFAKTDTVSIGGSTDTINVNEDYYSYIKSINTSNFRNYNNGYMTFSVSISGQVEVYQIQVIKANNKNFVCDIGTSQGYKDSSVQVYTYTAKCNVDFDDSLVNRIQVYGFAHGGNKYITFSSNASYYSYDTDSSIVNAINNSNSTSAINNMNNTINNAINNQSNQQHQDSTNINNSIKDTNQSVKDINNTLKDSSVDNNNAQNTFDGLNSNMASNNTISSLLLMPIRLLQKLLNAFNGSCSAINTGRIFDTDLILPCIDIESIIGSALWNLIDVVGAGALAYAIGKKMVKIFNQFTNLKEGGLESAYD